MTEDDTFRVLAHRIPFYEMMKLYRTSKDVTPKDAGEWDQWFKQYGWNWKEFSAQWRQWNGGQGTYSDFELTKK